MQSNPSVLISVKTGSSILQRALNTIPAHTHTEGEKKKKKKKLVLNCSKEDFPDIQKQHK